MFFFSLRSARYGFIRCFRFLLLLLNDSKETQINSIESMASKKGYIDFNENSDSHSDAHPSNDILKAPGK